MLSVQLYSDKYFAGKTKNVVFFGLMSLPLISVDHILFCYTFKAVKYLHPSLVSASAMQIEVEKAKMN